MRLMSLMTRYLVLALLLAAPAAGAVTFPVDSEFVPLRCSDKTPMTDAFGDDPNFLTDRDLVGDVAAPAGFRAADATNLYLRIRLDQNPTTGSTLHAFSWGMAFDLDGDRTTYELLILVDGVGGGPGAVEVFKNTTITITNSGTDPADTPPVATFPFANNARAVTAPGTTNGGTPDFFLDFAVPWTALQPLGLDHATRTYVWAASSDAANALTGDFACHDEGSGPATLDGTASDQTTGDPANDPNGSGSGGSGTNGPYHLEGGGGCAAGGSPGALAMIAVLALRRRRQR